jgi:hypothetical protein
MDRRASDVLRKLSEQPPLTDDERFGAALPSLRLKPESTVEATASVEIVDGLRALDERRMRNVLVRDSASGLEAVLVPVERYVELVGRELQLSREVDVREDGRLQPRGAHDADVEVVDPTAEWPHLRRR